MLSQYGLAGKNRIVFFSPEQCKIGYAISTMAGQSGSSIVAYEKIIAIHNGGGKKEE
jgi:V8-like Glu-specific endopeptidase